MNAPARPIAHKKWWRLAKASQRIESFEMKPDSGKMPEIASVEIRNVQ
jgi:hypothetical protein